ncbi:hypothetical protein MMPV_001822 [Pyropia vietnamensis]
MDAGIALLVFVGLGALVGVVAFVSVMLRRRKAQNAAVPPAYGVNLSGGSMPPPPPPPPVYGYPSGGGEGGGYQGYPPPPPYPGSAEGGAYGAPPPGYPGTYARGTSDK